MTSPLPGVPIAEDSAVLEAGPDFIVSKNATLGISSAQATSRMASMPRSRLVLISLEVVRNRSFEKADKGSFRVVPKIPQSSD